jgi:hypothetical protein
MEAKEGDLARGDICTIQTPSLPKASPYNNLLTKHPKTAKKGERF